MHCVGFELRTALYKHAFNPGRPAGTGSPAAQILDWAKQASLPIGCLGEPAVLRAIARRLFIAPGTVKVHLSHIFGKLGITTRGELAARAASQDRTAR